MGIFFTTEAQRTQGVNRLRLSGVTKTSVSSAPRAKRAVKKNIRFFAVLVIAVLMLITSAPCAYAAFHEQLAIDTVAISLANTVTARPPGHMSIHYNPAGLSQLPDGKYFSNGLTVPIIQKTSSFNQDPGFEGFLGGFKDDPVDGKSGTSSSGRMYLPFYNDTIDFLLAPTLGLSYRKPGSKWTFAVGQYAPFAVGLVHGDDGDPSVHGGKSVYQQHLVYIAPAVSYQMTPTFSMGLTVGLGQTAMGAEVDMRAPNELVALTKVLGDATEGLEIPILSELTLPPPWFGGGLGPYDQVASFSMNARDDFSPNFNVGFLWEPSGWLALGACYQSPIKTQLTGNYRFDYSEDWQRMVNWFGSSPLLVITSGVFDLPMEPVSHQSGTVTTQITFPQRAQFGIKVKPFSKLSIMADLHWADWSVLNQDQFIFDQDIQLLKLVKMLGYTGGNDTLISETEFRRHLALERGTGIRYSGLAHLPLRLRTTDFLCSAGTVRSDVCPAGPGELRRRIRFPLEKRHDHRHCRRLRHQRKL